MRDIIKYFIGITITILLVGGIAKFIKKNTGEEKHSMINCIEQVIPAMANLNEEYNKIVEEDEEIGEQKSIFKNILETQISSIKGIEESVTSEVNVAENATATENKDGSQEGEEQQNTEESGEIQLANTNLPTQVITQNPLSDSSNTQYGNVKIKNETSYALTEEILKPDITIENKNIVLFHTHSCESYTASEKYPYTPTGNFRTTDLNYTVTRVGTELETYLKEYGYNVIHNTDYHDYPAYNGSYTRSLATVQNILQTTPSDIIIDVHRDAIGSRSDYAPTVKIGDTDEAAQLMFVIGTNEGGLWHPNWNQNLKFAVMVQSKAEEMYPGLFKPMMLTKSRYNQHTGKYASIIEVGATREYFRAVFNEYEIFSKSSRRGSKMRLIRSVPISLILLNYYLNCVNKSYIMVL